MSSFDFITKHYLRTLAGERWFARGEAYHQQARVTDVTTNHDEISASVLGRDSYRVRLACHNNRFTYSCTCPVGTDGNFCKHCVAQQLVELVLSEASRNRRLRDKLEFEQAASASTSPDLSAFRKALTHATRTTGVDYYSMPRFARRLLEVIDAIRGLLVRGQATAVVELTEYGFKRLEHAIGQVDDSDGHFQKIIPQLTELHHAACVLAQEEPVSLAQRLFQYEVKSDWDLFRGASEMYADVLGQKGLQEYKRLAEELWSKIPALKPGDDGNERCGIRFRITSIMETLAHQSGDLQDLIAVKQRDLSHPYSFLQIAELYREAGEHDLALQWAEQGAHSFECLDPRLSDFMATEYHRRGLHDKAMMLIWEQFVARPGLEMYKHLHENALRVTARRETLRLVGKDEGTNQRLNEGDSTRTSNKEWEHWRTQALRFLRERIDPSSLPARRQAISISNPWNSRDDRSVLVEIFLWERNYEQAWHEASAYGCSAYLWLQLADGIAQDQPARAYLVYKELIGPTVEATNNASYSEAINLLKKMQNLTSGLNCESDFNDHLMTARRIQTQA